ncbi:MAG: dihydrolipoyl dehydrogenase, partial [Spirochaetaceae bacterium]
MQEIQTEVAIIGAGSAGIRAFQSVTKLGGHAVLIEGGEYGTTCARVGCMPSKLLIAAAEAAHSPKHADEFGISIPEVKVDGQKVMQRVKNLRDRFAGSAAQGTLAIDESKRLRGWAKFVDRNTLLVDDKYKVSARSIVIASGSRPAILPIFKDLGDRLIVNDDVFSWDDLPESVVVFGPGIIGLEIGQALHRLGVRIRMFGIQGLIGPLTDADIKARAEAIFGNEFPLDTDAQVESVSRDGNSVLVRYKSRDAEGNITGQVAEERFDYVLAATGRRPNIDNLNIEATGLPLDASGIPLFDRNTMQCSDSNIFIAGDANNDLPLLHEASDEGLIAGRNAYNFPNINEGQRTVPLSVVFTDPQIAMVGKSREQLEAAATADDKQAFAVGELHFSKLPRARMMGDNKGLLRLYAKREDGTLLGAEMIGPKAEHFAHLLAWSMGNNMTASQMLDQPFYHPVYEEGLR